jgi:hypothetical protein
MTVEIGETRFHAGCFLVAAHHLLLTSVVYFEPIESARPLMDQ